MERPAESNGSEGMETRKGSIGDEPENGWRRVVVLVEQVGVSEVERLEHG